jgi:hypothetical protein
MLITLEARKRPILLERQAFRMSPVSDSSSSHSEGFYSVSVNELCFASFALLFHTIVRNKTNGLI